MEQELNQIRSTPQSNRAQAYIDKIQTAIELGPGCLKTFIQSVCQESLVIARKVLEQVAAECEKIKDEAVCMNSIQAVLDALNEHGTSFEETNTQLRQKLSLIYQEQEEWTRAAQVLTGISLEHISNDEEKLKILMRIVKLLLEDEDAVGAESYFNRASMLVHSRTDRELQLSHQLSQARILDYQRKFQEASLKYHQTSFIVQIDEQERLYMLSAAIICAVLSPAGPQRSRMLASLHRDERSQNLPSFPILSKVFLEHIIKPEEAAEFAKTLSPHQLAELAQASRANMFKDRNDDNDDDDDTMSDGAKSGPQTVLDRSIMEHNVLAVSRIYNNITLPGLGAILNLKPFAAEEMVRQMIIQKRLRASIDQTESLIIFDPKGNELEGVVSNVAALATDENDENDVHVDAPEMYRWDENLRKTSQQVESIAQQCSKLLVK